MSQTLRKTISIFSAVFLGVILLSSLFIFAGCGGEMIDGIRLSRISYKSTPTWQDAERYNLTFSCKVENTTSDDLQFEIVYSGRFGGIFSKISTRSQVIVLPAKTSREINYVWEKTGKDVYYKEIAIIKVQIYEG